MIVPPEYRSLGCLPADQFVPQLMQHLGLGYYVGLLTAASLHGAGHQSPMTFQVVVTRNRPELRCGKVRVQFVARANAAAVPTVQKNTPRGYLLVSTVEATAFDLVGYSLRAGGLSNVATILAELHEVMQAGKLVAVAGLSPVPWAQRLGYLLRLVGADAAADGLADYVGAQARDYVALRPDLRTSGAVRDARWRLLVNDKVEADV